MTTLKLTKKTTETTAEQAVAKKAPVRRADASKRDRSKPFIKAERPAENQKMDGRSSKLQPEASFSRFRGNDGGVSQRDRANDRQAGKSESARQRNHRHDGSLRDAEQSGRDAQRPNNRRPANRDGGRDANEGRDRPILRSEFKDRKFVGDKPARDGSARNERRRDDFRPQNNRADNRAEEGFRGRAGDYKKPNRPLSPAPLPLKGGEGNMRAKPLSANTQGTKKSEAVSSTRAFEDREGSYRNPPRRGGKVRDGFVASEFDKNRNKNMGNKARTLAEAAASAKPLSPTPLPLEKGEGTNDLPRLSKVMADRGLCSRREADDWIANGWVKVDGEIIDQLGTRVAADAEIVISGYAKESQADQVTILLHKPVGYVSGQAEDGYEPAVVLVHPDNEWLDDPDLLEQKTFQRGFLRNLAPAGRLDIDSTGLLVLTQDGRVARHLIGEDSSVEKEYLVRVEGNLDEGGLKKLNFGLSLDGVKLKPAKVSWQNEDQLRFVLREGKKRQIRRMCELVGLHVVGLKRIRIGSVNLGKLPVGQWRYLRHNERF